MKLQHEHRQFLHDLFGRNVLFEEEDMYPYASDASLRRGQPLAVVHPESVEQIQELFRWADSERIPLYPRARGTNTVGDCVPTLPGIVVSSGKMTAIEEISETDFVGVAQPGVITADFQNACAKKKLFYPPDAGSVKSSTLAGNLITCAGGMQALKYGVTRDFVLGLDAVLPGGKLIHLGGRTHKNVVGLDLARLFVGSEGTLGFVTRVILKLLPLPEATASLMAGFTDNEAAMKAVQNVFRAGMLPTALEFIGRELVQCIASLKPVPWPETAKVILLFRFDGSPEGVRRDLERLAPHVREAVWSMQGVGSDEEALWALRRMTNPAAFVEGPFKLSEDIVVPRGQLLTALQQLEEIGKVHGKKVLTCGHVGDGNIHVNIMCDPDNAEDMKRSEAAKHDVLKMALRLGGTMSGEHGVGIVKHIEDQIGPAEVELMRRIRTVFDPNGILNPGKAY